MGKFRARRLQRDAATLFQCLGCWQRVPTRQVEMAAGKPLCAACRAALDAAKQGADRPDAAERLAEP